jgi:TonB family protein
VAKAGRQDRVVRAERKTLRFALVASLLFHLGLLVWVRALPQPTTLRTQTPLTFTLVERPARRRESRPPAPPPVASPAPGRPCAQAASRPGLPAALPAGPAAMMPIQDVPVAKQPSAGPSLRDMSAASAEAVVAQRGPQHKPGDSPQERLTESLARGTGAMAVQRGGFWDAYFTSLKKALLQAWVGDATKSQVDGKATTRVRLVMDAEGALEDFDILLGSGNPALDAEVRAALHETKQFPPPPDNVMHGKTELVTEWELTVHPGLAAAAGTPVFGPGWPSINFDMVTMVNPKVDLKPLEFNVVLATYWTR